MKKEKPFRMNMGYDKQPIWPYVRDFLIIVAIICTICFGAHYLKWGTLW